jgi:hypothetical protein
MRTHLNVAHTSRAADEKERDRLLEIVAPEVGALGRAITEILKLFLRNPRCA